MARKLQIRRGSAKDNDGFTGREGELTVNTDDYSLRVHDGETVGGHALATEVGLSKAIPSGVICMWSGSESSIPSGWYLCNGSNGTPDLRDKFIVGAGSSYSVKATGGASTVTLTTSQIPSHTHSFTTGSAGAHTHNVAFTGESTAEGAYWGRYSAGREASGAFRIEEGGMVGPGDHGKTCFKLILDHSLLGGTVDSAGAHTHTGTTNSIGSGASIENRPPYYALCFIMKG